MLSQGPEARMYRPQHLRFVFDKDSDGKVAKSEDGMRLVAAVERISGGVVIDTTQVRPSNEKQIPEAAEIPTSADIFVSEPFQLT